MGYGIGANIWSDCIILVAPHSPGIEQDSQDLAIELAQADSQDSAEGKH